MQYLLGELPAEELAKFERELAVSPILNKELATQSELICMISATDPAEVEVSATTHRTGSDDRTWRLLTLISALAACFVASGRRNVGRARRGNAPGGCGAPAIRGRG